MDMDGNLFKENKSMQKEKIKNEEILTVNNSDLIAILNCIVADKDYSFFLDVFERMRNQANKYAALVKEGKI